MKYKNINSAIHNLGHSFVSDMNYVDDDFIINDLNKIHRRNKDISINWLIAKFESAGEKTERLIKSIAYYCDSLEAHFKKHNI